MPSPVHEALTGLFRQRPALAAELLTRPLGTALPAWRGARVDSGDLTDHAHRVLCRRGRAIPVPEQARGRILSCTDVDQLERWLRRAVIIDQIDELFA